MLTVAVIVGSLRKHSFNQKLARALEKLAHSQLKFNFIQLEDIPLYNQDLDTNLPPAVISMKQAVTAANAVLFVTPEYNRSIPGVLKNIIDWGTRPYGENCWRDKPTAIIGTSPGNVGTAAAQSHLRSIMTVLGVRLMGQPEVYLVYKEELIDENFLITNEGTKKFLHEFLNKFALWITTN